MIGLSRYLLGLQPTPQAAQAAQAPTQDGPRPGESPYAYFRRANAARKSGPGSGQPATGGQRGGISPDILQQLIQALTARMAPQAGGAGRPDSVPATLTPGEYVMPQPMVQQMGGPGMLDQFRADAMGQPRPFAGGGFVAPQLDSGFMAPRPDRPNQFGAIGGPNIQPLPQGQFPAGPAPNPFPGTIELGDAMPFGGGTLGGVGSTGLNLGTGNTNPYAQAGNNMGNGSLPNWLDPRAIAANPQGFQDWQNQARQAGFNYGPNQTAIPQVQPPANSNPFPGTIQLGDAMPFGQSFPTPGPGLNPGQRVESIFGQTGMPSTPLQRQSIGGIQQFLNQPSPESRTQQLLQPGLMEMFGGGQGIPQNIQNALGGQLGGQNPLGQDLQGILRGIAGNGNPLPGQAQNTLMGGLNTDVLGGGVGDLLRKLAGGGGGATSGLMSLMQGGGGGADTSALQRELSFNPNEQMLSALQPQFQRNLDLANQAGGRFGSANAQMRGQALNDYNLMASQALQQDLARRGNLASALGQISGQSAASQNATRLGAGQGAQAGQLGALGQLMGGAQGSAGLQQQAAQLLGGFGQAGIGNQQRAAGMLGGFEQQGLQNQQGVADLLGRLGLGYGQLNQSGTLGAGQLMGNLAGQTGGAEFGRLLGAYGVGGQQAQQADVGTGRNLAILLQQLGAMQGATLGAPVQTTPSGAQQGAAMGGGIAQLLAYLQASGALGGSGGGIVPAPQGPGPGGPGGWDPTGINPFGPGGPP